MELTEELLADPVQFAQWATDTYLIPTYNLDAQTLCPSEAEIVQWEITEHEIALCRCEFPLMAAAGVAVTVAKTLPFEYYNTFISALCGRMIGMLYGHYSAAFVKDAKDNIELYIAHLEGQNMVAFASRYTERVFDGNPNESEIFAAQLWQRAMDVLLQAMNASRESLVNLFDGKK